MLTTPSSRSHGDSGPWASCCREVGQPLLPWDTWRPPVFGAPMGGLGSVLWLFCEIQSIE